MAPSNSRSGFTLIEVMVATTISAIVFATIASTFLFCQRMFRFTMADAELTLALREVRDKLLFHAGPGMDEGLLTGIVSADTGAITMNWETDLNGFGNGPDKIRILIKNDSKGNFFANDRIAHTPANERWFCPNDFRLLGNWSATVDYNATEKRYRNTRIQIDMGSTKVDDVRETTWILLPTPENAPDSR